MLGASMPVVQRCLDIALRWRSGATVRGRSFDPDPRRAQRPKTFPSITLIHRRRFAGFVGVGAALKIESSELRPCNSS
jgi:hypothetical protein